MSDLYCFCCTCFHCNTSQDSAYTEEYEKCFHWHGLWIKSRYSSAAWWQTLIRLAVICSHWAIVVDHMVTMMKPEQNQRNMIWRVSKSLSEIVNLFCANCAATSLTPCIPFTKRKKERKQEREKNQCFLLSTTARKEARPEVTLHHRSRSVPRLIEEDITRLRVLRGVRCQPVEFFNSLCIYFL